MDNDTTLTSSTLAGTDTPAWPPLTLAERDRLRQQAMARAHALRAEAINEFWRGTDAWFGAAADHTRRAATRLAARLHQHIKRRAAGAPCTAEG